MLALALAWGTAAGCATTMTDDELTAALRRAVANRPGLPDEYVVVAVNAESEMDAWAQVADSTGGGKLPLARRLARGMERRAEETVVCVIGGYYEQLVERVLVDAFSVVRVQRMPGMSLIVVTPEPVDEVVAETAARFGVSVAHQPLPPPEE